MNRTKSTVPSATSASVDALREGLEQRENERARPDADKLTAIEEAAERFMATPDAPEAVPVSPAEIKAARAEAEARVAEELEVHLRRQADEERRVREEMTRAAATGTKIRPVRTDEEDTYLDETVPTDCDGAVIHPTGPNGEPLVGRWVRMTGNDGRPSIARAARFRNAGYQALIDPKTGKPVTGALGMFMVAPPEAEARRQAEHLRGLVPLDEYEERHVDGLAEQLNSRAGRRLGVVDRPRGTTATVVRGPMEAHTQV